MRQANINGENVNFDLSGRSRDSYNDWGDKVSYLGEGTILTNIKGEKVTRPELIHFWSIN